MFGRASPRFADANHVAVGVTDVEFAGTPWLVGRSMGDVEALGDTTLVQSVKVVDPDRHPGPLVRCLIALRTESQPVGTAAAPALAVTTQEDFGPGRLDR